MSKAGATSKADTAVKLVLIFFISLLSFSVGTYVGKQVSDSDARRAALEVDPEASAHGEPQHETAETAATAPVADEDIASLTEEFLQKGRNVASEEAPAAAEHGAPAAHDDHHAETDAEGYTHHGKMKAASKEQAAAANAERTHGQAPAATHHEAAGWDTKKSAHGKSAATAGATTTSAAAERVAHDKSPAVDAKKTREPSAALPSVASTAIGKYTVQVASYATENEAKDQAAKLTNKGYSAFYVPAEVNSKTWYRVSVGLFSDHKTATNYRTELLATQAVTSAIVQKIVK